MNHLLPFIIAIAIFLIIYYYINKTKEHFNNVDEEIQDEEQANELVKKHQIGYGDKVYDFNYIIETDGDSVENPKNRISLWQPISQTGLYNVGTPISINNERPDRPYTALEGSELINPVKFELLYRHGDSRRGINQDITDIDNQIANKKTRRDQYKSYMDIYDQQDPRYHITKAVRVDNNDFRYPVINESYWSSRRRDRKYHGNNMDWWRFRSRDHLWGFTHLHMAPYLVITIKYRAREYGDHGSWVDRTAEISGWDHSQNMEFGTNEEGLRAVKKHEIDLSRVLNNDMRHDIKWENLRKNQAVRNMWQQQHDKLNNEINQLEAQKDVQTQALNKGMFTIWRPIPPEGYRTFGYIFLNGHNKPMLSDIKCVPERCSKETREWKLEDKMLSFKSEGMRYNFYKNPFHITLHVFIEKQVNGSWEYIGQNPEKTKIFRVYPCVPKCNYVDNLIKANECAQNMCLNKKKDLSSRPLRYRKSDTEAENMMLDEIKEQDILLEELKKTAKDLQLKQNKFDIIHKEFNRHELKHFLQNQGQLHRDTIDKLLKSKNGVAVNINSPGGMEALKAMLRDYLIHHAQMLKNNKNANSGQNMGASCTNWTEFKQNHRCKYSDPPCFGCVNPN